MHWFFYGFSWFFQRTGFQRTGDPLIFIDGHPSMNIIDGHPSMIFIDGYPSMNINGFPVLWVPFLEPMDGLPFGLSFLGSLSLGPMGPGPLGRHIGLILGLLGQHYRPMGGE